MVLLLPLTLRCTLCCAYNSASSALRPPSVVLMQPVVAGDENPLCTAAISELPGYSRVLYMCPGDARYITLQAPSAPALDVCTLSVFVQSACQGHPPVSCQHLAAEPSG